MSDNISPTAVVAEPRKKRQRRAIDMAIAVDALSVSPRVAEQMLDYGETKIKELIRSGELESYRDGGARRILTASIHDYIRRKLESSKATASRGPSRPKRTANP